jgi:PST family polysaccharide transporter
VRPGDRLRRLSLTVAADDETREAAKGIGRRTRRGLWWTAGSTIGVNAVRLVSFPILGRMLLPVDFGIAAAALTIVVFAQTVRDLGVGPALVQRRTITADQVSAGFNFAVVMGLALAALVFAAAPAVAWFYDQPELTSIVRVLAVLFLLRGVASVPQALCQRAMQFRAIAIIDFVSFAAGSGLSIGLAAAGFGAWALVYGYLLEAAIATVAVFALAPQPLRRRPPWRELRELLRFGAGNTVSDVAGYFAYHGDYMVVGNRLGAERLGFYNRAYDLMRIPSVLFSNLAAGVLFSAFSRIQDDPDRLGRALRRGLFAAAVVLMPASAAFVVAAPEVIAILLGEGWHDAVLPFQILAVSMLARTSFRLGLIVARSAGDVVAMAICNILYAAMIVGGAFAGSAWGITGVSVATSIAVFVNFISFTHIGLRHTTLTWAGFLAVHAEAAFATALAVVALVPSVGYLRDLGAHELVIAACAGMVCAVAVAVALALGLRRSQPDWRWLWTGVTSRLRRRPSRMVP